MMKGSVLHALFSTILDQALHEFSQVILFVVIISHFFGRNLRASEFLHKSDVDDGEENPPAAVRYSSEKPNTPTLVNEYLRLY